MKKIGIIAAMDEECEEIEKLMTNKERKSIFDLTFFVGKIEEKKCILVKSGVGKVNAARTTQIMVDHFKVDYILNLGSAGAINNNLEIGDVVIGKYVVQHDFDITAFGHSKGYITGIGNSIVCDREKVEEMEKKIYKLPNDEYKVKFGVIATGDIFCTEIAMKDKIRARFNADVVDMECAAIGQVAFLNEVPFMAIRSVSDSPNGENASTFDENLKLASKRCADMLEIFLK